MAIKSYHIILAVKILGWFLLKWAAFGLKIANPIWQHCLQVHKSVLQKEYRKSSSKSR